MPGEEKEKVLGSVGLAELIGRIKAAVAAAGSTPDEVTITENEDGKLEAVVDQSGGVTSYEKHLADIVVADEETLTKSGNTMSAKDGGIGTEQLADGSVTTVKLADDAVTSDKLADGSVGTSNLQDSSVTLSKIPGGGSTKFLTGGSTNPVWSDMDLSIFGFKKIWEGSVRTTAISVPEISNYSIIVIKASYKSGDDLADGNEHITLVADKFQSDGVNYYVTGGYAPQYKQSTNVFQSSEGALAKFAATESNGTLAGIMLGSMVYAGSFIAFGELAGYVREIWGLA